jgi:hypothetical protein
MYPFIWHSCILIPRPPTPRNMNEESAVIRTVESSPFSFLWNCWICYHNAWSFCFTARDVYLQRFKSIRENLIVHCPCDLQAGLDAIATAWSLPAIVYLGPLYMVLHSLAGQIKLHCATLFRYTSVSQTVVLGFCPCGPLRLSISPKKKTEKIKLTWIAYHTL